MLVCGCGDCFCCFLFGVCVRFQWLVVMDGTWSVMWCLCVGVVIGVIVSVWCVRLVFDCLL